MCQWYLNNEVELYQQFILCVDNQPKTIHWFSKFIVLFKLIHVYLYDASIWMAFEYHLNAHTIHMHKFELDEKLV